MNTITEVEAAIEKLSPPELAELAAWFEEFQHSISSSAAVFAIYEKEDAELS